MIPVIRAFREFAEDRRGAVLVELGFAIPVLMMILIGCFEATRYVLLNQKLDRAASAVADLVAQQSALTEAQLNDLFDAAERIVEPFDLSAAGQVVVSSVYRAGANPATIVWQRESAAGATSEIGDEGAAATLPGGFVVNTGENVIVAEVFYDYRPFFLRTVFDPVLLYHNAFNRPRDKVLTQVTP